MLFRSSGRARRRRPCGRGATQCSATDDTSVTEISDVRYARSGDVSIAYQVDGDGPVDLVFVRGNRPPPLDVGWRGAGRRRCSPPPTRAHNHARRPEPLDQGAAHSRRPVGAVGRRMARDAAVLIGPARARRVLRSARGRGRATRLSTMRGASTRGSTTQRTRRRREPRRR